MVALAVYAPILCEAEGEAMTGDDAKEPTTGKPEKQDV